MITLRQVPFIFLLPIWLVACSGEKEQPAQVNPLDDFDTLYVKTGSVLNIDRYRIFTNKNALFKIGKMKMQLQVKDLQTGVHAAYPIDSGTLVYNKKYFTAHCFISTKAIQTPVIDSAQQLNMDTPAYLLRGKSPVIILEYQGNFYPEAQSPSATCYLTINDSTALLNNAENKIGQEKKTISTIATKAYVDGLKWNLFEPVKGEKIEKDSIRLDLEVQFEKRKKPAPKA